MRVTIHQPEHLPWLGLAAKTATADLLISLDTVPYRHHYFQNRNRIALNGEPTWLTVPVLHRGHQQTEIADIRIDATKPWKRKYVGTLRQAYGKATYGHEAVEPLAAIIENAPERLAALNSAIIEWLYAGLGVRTPMYASSTRLPRGRQSGLLADLCADAGASTYLSGPSGRDYLDLAPFAARGIAVEFYDFEHPRYAQPGSGEFISHLATIDVIANHGWDGAAEVLATALEASRCVPA